MFPWSSDHSHCYEQTIRLDKFLIHSRAVLSHSVNNCQGRNRNRKWKMPCGTIDIHPLGRRQLGMACMGLSLLQCLLGVAILSCGIHYLRNLHWKLSVVHDHNTYSLGFMILMTGSALSFVHLCTAKIFYDSGRDETRRRFEFLLFPTVVAFGVFLIFQFSLLIACKAHRDYDLERFREGFLVGITKYSFQSDMKVHMDRLQSKDQCCGADNFMDWIESDWVAPQFNPLSDPNMDFRAKSLYWPWSLLPPYRLDVSESREEIASNYEPAQQKVIPDSNSQTWLSSGKAEAKSNQPVTFPPLNIRMPRRLKRSERLGDAISKARDKANRISASARMESYSQRFPPSENREHLSVVPWSCCSVDYYGPCVHDYVTQRILTRELGVRDYWNGESLSQQGCAPLLQAKYKSYSQACLVLFSMAFPLQVLLLVTARYMQTCVENIDMYNREDGSAPGYLIPCSWFGGVDFKSIAKHKIKPSKPLDNETPSDKDETSVSLLDEFDKLKQKKRRKNRQLKNLLNPKSRRRHSESQGSDQDSQDSENEAPVKPQFQSRRNSNDIDAPPERLVPTARRKSRRIQVDEKDFGRDKIVTDKGRFIPNKIMKAGKRLFGTPAHKKRKARDEGEWSQEPERPLLDDDDRSPEDRSKRNKVLRVPSPKNLYRKLKKGTKRYIDKQSRSRI